MTSTLLPRSALLSSPRHDVTWVGGSRNLANYLSLRAANPSNSSADVRAVVQGIALAIGFNPAYKYDPAAPNSQDLTPPLYWPGDYSLYVFDGCKRINGVIASPTPAFAAPTPAYWLNRLQARCVLWGV